METLIQKEHGDNYRYKPKLKGRRGNKKQVVPQEIKMMLYEEGETVDQ